MDAGLAATLGALAGAVATTGAAFATGWAQRETSKISARAEYQRQRHEARHSAYKSFISLTSSLCDITVDIKSCEPDYQEFFTENLGRSCEALEGEIREAWIEVCLLGPKEITQPATKILGSASQIKLATGLAGACRASGIPSEIRAMTSAPVSELMARATKTVDRLPLELSAFITAAQDALGDDGAGVRKG